MASDEAPTDSLSIVAITTDGATRGNPGPGGWAVLLEHGAHERLIDGEEPSETTNNVMELVAVAVALEALRRPCRVVLRCDSTYVLEGLQRLIDGGALPKKNRAVWERLHTAAARHTLELSWVKGHAGDARNERVDDAANADANRAYDHVAAQRGSNIGDDTWVLALCSATSGRPVGWSLRTPHGLEHGSIGAAGVTQLANMFYCF
jgi:ribonuclease HI